MLNKIIEEKDLKCWNKHPRDGFSLWFSKFEDQEEIVIVQFQDSDLEVMSLQQVAYYLYQDILITNDTAIRDYSIYKKEILECRKADDLYEVSSQEHYPAMSISILESINKDGFENVLEKYGYDFDDLEDEDYEDENVIVFIKKMIKDFADA